MTTGQSDGADPLWTELRGIADRMPRYSTRDGQRCQVCGFGATGIESVVGVWWATCRPCGTRWCLGVGVFEPPRIEVDPDVRMTADELVSLEEHFLFERMRSLAEYIELRSEGSAEPQTAAFSTQRKSEPIQTGEAMPRNSSPTMAVATPQIDPNAYLTGPREGLLLAGARLDIRAHFVSTVMSELASCQEHANGPSLEHLVWSSIRARVFQGKSIERHLVEAGCNDPVGEIGRCIGRILRGQTRRVALLALRHQIDAAIAQLDPLEIVR